MLGLSRTAAGCMKAHLRNTVLCNMCYHSYRTVFQDRTATTSTTAVAVHFVHPPFEKIVTRRESAKCWLNLLFRMLSPYCTCVLYLNCSLCNQFSAQSGMYSTKKMYHDSSHASRGSLQNSTIVGVAPLIAREPPQNAPPKPTIITKF